MSRILDLGLRVAKRLDRIAFMFMLQKSAEEGSLTESVALGTRTMVRDRPCTSTAESGKASGPAARTQRRPEQQQTASGRASRTTLLASSRAERAMPRDGAVWNCFKKKEFTGGGYTPRGFCIDIKTGEMRQEGFASI